MKGICPRCGTEHLHLSVLVDADSSGSRYEGIELTDGGDVMVRPNSEGLLQVETGLVSCCACDWNDERTIRFVD
jgi:hypothetical protein